MLGTFPGRLLPPAGRRHGGFLGGAGGPGAWSSPSCHLPISYLWYNLIGCAACIGLSLVLQAAERRGGPAGGGPGMSAPVICFGQQPCGFFPRRFLAAKICTARRLQARDRRGDRLFLPRQRPRPAGDADHPAPPQDRRAARPQLRLREQAPAQVVPALPQAGPAGVARADGAPASGLCRPALGRGLQRVQCADVADFCLEMYRAHGAAGGHPRRPLERPGRSGARPATSRNTSSTCPTRGDGAGPVRRRRSAPARGRRFIPDLPRVRFEHGTNQPDPGLAAFAGCNRSSHCTHYVTGAGEQAYLRPADAPEVTFVHRDTIERSDEAYTDLPA